MRLLLIFCRSSLQTSKLADSVGSASKKNDLDRFKQNDSVKYQTLIFDVKKIILKLLTSILYRCAIGIFDLCPTGQSWRDQMTLFVIGNLLSKLGHKVGAFGTGADEVHLTTKYVPKLGDLVDANLADNASHSGSPIITLDGPYRAFHLSIYAH